MLSKTITERDETNVLLLDKSTNEQVIIKIEMKKDSESLALSLEIEKRTQSSKMFRAWRAAPAQICQVFAQNFMYNWQKVQILDCLHTV
jgi:hypothetical protein